MLFIRIKITKMSQYPWTYRSQWRSYHRLQSKGMVFENTALNDNEIIDLRSDTVTKPSEKMRESMRFAEVGDDVFKEDRTVTELENRMAEIAGKEAGLFVVSGTMGNLLSVLSHCGRRGAEAILGDQSHIFLYEQANIAQFGGVQPFTIPTSQDGTFSLSHVETCIRNHSDFHNPQTELICAENTHGSFGGKVLPKKWIDQLATFASDKGLPLHLDGARVFNASIASGIPVASLTKPFDTISICLSKGLGAPIGTVIVGSDVLINRARRLRKALGGGWRQAGCMAAAGLYALENNIEKLLIDHDNAMHLAKGINSLKTVDAYVNENDVHTNMVILKLNSALATAEDFCLRMMVVSNEEEKELGCKVIVKALPRSESTIRFVTHLDVSRQQLEKALLKIKYIIQEKS